MRDRNGVGREYDKMASERERNAERECEKAEK